MKIFSLLFLTLFCLNSFAGDVFKIKNREFSDDNIETLGNTLFDELEDQINSESLNLNQEDFLKGMGNANILAGKGIGTDYSNDIDLFVVGYGIGFAIDVGDNELGENDSDQIPGGVSIQPGFMLGFSGAFLGKIGPLDGARTDFLFNFSSADLSTFSEDDADLEIDGEVSGFGMHIRYAVVEPVTVVPLGMLKWGGIHFTTGYERSVLNLEFTQTVDDVEEEDGTMTSSITDASATLGADVTTNSIPFEISTYVQLAYLFTFHAGLGFDYNWGTAESIAEISGDVEAEETVTGESGSGDLSLDIGEEEKVDSTMTRAFFGAQMNLTVLKLFINMGTRLDSNAMNVAVGGKIAW